MEDRLRHLLTLVVQDVIATGEPVGSQRLVDTYRLGVSPATIRNWFTELESAGYITQPHTSSGRIPTEEGYRLYVNELMPRRMATKREQQDIHEVAGAFPWPRSIKAVAKSVAHETHAAVVVGLDQADTFYTGLSLLFAEPEFRDAGRVVNMTQVLDRLDDILQIVRKQRFAEPTAFIGRECPFGPTCSTVLVTLGDNTLFGALGPLRMDYGRTFALLSTISQRFTSPS
jgi:transcriptional regulator of heat shock response